MSQELNRDKLLHQQNVRNIQDKAVWEEIVTEVDRSLAEAKMITNFRRYFKWWIKTKEGHIVKENLLIYQESRCFKCKGMLLIPGMGDVSVNHSEVHHPAPLALLQQYAESNPQIKLAALRVFVTSEQYLKLVHPKCNKQFGEQIGYFSELDFLREFLEENR
jgi:hypothetical protein